MYNKLCEFTEAFSGQRLHLVVYLGYLFYFGMGASVEDLYGVLLGINQARLSLDGKKVPPGYDLVDHIIGNCGKFDSLVIDFLKLDSLVVDTIVK
ncbi:hypothetical protein DSO57_1024119 [Entomophthora muscae]|uniref:Uncharacterized protein n=1 Tax=Entomophthora muscae TaxID=34485 RepID=A0ACC2U1R4_9FUNG|nr:hypothetical protein DSO57_1024119 [Entomophthora muscae]